MTKITDFLVIGSGIAGLNAALTLAPFGAVLLITKKTVTDASTTLAQGGIAAVTEKNDSFSAHIADTLAAGYHHNKKDAVELLVTHAPDAIARLKDFGVPFADDVTLEAAHSSPRIWHAGDITGAAIEKALLQKAKCHSAITIWKHTTAVDLIVKESTCQGVTVIGNKAIFPAFSRATILATGGVGQLFQWTTNPLVATGDGIAMAYRAGATLADLEFVQFHPTALKHGPSPLFLLSEALRGEGAYLRNKSDERFMASVHPLAELAPRDVVARAIVSEQNKGDVYLDIRHASEQFLQKRFPSIYRELKKRGFDLSTTLIPVTPAAHFLCGGIATDHYGRTSIGNLFAYGEVAATGVHGANRLASNSLLECMVFSAQIAHCIGELPQKAQEIPFRIPKYQKKTAKDDFRKRLQECMWTNVGITRTTPGLAQAVSLLTTMRKEYKEQQSVNEEIIERMNMIQTALLIARAAAKRKKSLGAHYIT